MQIKASNEEYVPPSEGMVDAVVVDLIDLGTQETQWGKKQRVKIVYEIDEEKENGYRYLVSRTYNLSFHEKSAFRKDLKSIRGHDLTEVELENGLDSETIKGIPCRLVLGHEEGQDGNVYARIDGMTTPGEHRLLPSGHYVRFEKDFTRPSKIEVKQTTQNDDATRKTEQAVKSA